METQSIENREETVLVGKDSPLTDITTSPPAFDLSSENIDLLKPLVAADAVPDTSADVLEHPLKAGSYSSSELSDLGEDDSEAETDKMDFLDDDGNTSTEGVGSLDLNALSKLTELARLKEVDSDSDDEGIPRMKTEETIEEEIPESETAASEEEKPQLPQLNHVGNNEHGDPAEISEESPNNGKSSMDGNPLEEEDDEDEEAVTAMDISLDHPEDPSPNSKVENDDQTSLKRNIEETNDGGDIKRAKLEQITPEAETPDAEVEADGKEGDIQLNGSQHPIQKETESNGMVAEEDGKDVDSPKDSSESNREDDNSAGLKKEKDIAEPDNAASVEESTSAAGTDLENIMREDLNGAASESKEESQAENEEDAIEDEEEDEVGGDDSEATEYERNGNGSSGKKNTSQIEEIDLNEQRKLAVNELFDIEQSFAELRDKLFQDKLTLLEHELQLCLEGSHPELSKIYYKVNEFYQDSLQLANANLTYSLKCIDKETIATRTGVHQNFLRQLMDQRNELITDTTSLWYKINKERNQYDQLVPDFTYSAIPVVPKHAIPDENSGELTPLLVNEERLALGLEPNVVPLTKKTIKQNTLVELVKQRNNINLQLGIMNGLKQFYGMPAAVGTSLNNENSALEDELLLKRASEEEINEDLIAMGISI